MKEIFKSEGINPDPIKDQFFIADDEIAEQIVQIAEINGEDIVFEIGAGTGVLTRLLAQKAKKVIAFEIDRRFQNLLKELPSNIEMHFENAVKYFQLHGKFFKKREYNKIVSNPPYSVCEPLLHNLTFLNYDKAVLMIPVKLAYTIEKNPIFSSFFEVKRSLGIPKEKFYPVPKSNAVVVDLIKREDPIKTKNPGLFLKRYLYTHEHQLVKNALREGIIKYARLTQQRSVTKNEAREIVTKMGIKNELLNKHPDNHEVYREVESKAKHLEEVVVCG